MKRIIFFTILVVSFFVINNLVRSIYSLWKKQDLIVEAKKNLEVEKKRHEVLQQQLKLVESDAFVEREARDKLFMVKPGEKIVILPSISPEVEGSRNQKKESLPNWKQWLELFF